MAVIVLPLANQVQRQFADFPDIDMKFASKADFETAIKNTPRIPDGWLAYCVTEKKWYQADKTAGTANSIIADTDQVPSPGSANPVQSGGVYNALFNKADTGKNPGNINDMNLIGNENRGGFFRMDFDNTPIKNFPETTNCALVMQQGSIVRGLRLMSSYEKDNFYVQRANNNWGAAYKLVHSGNLDEFGIATQSGIKSYAQLTYNSTTNTYSGSLTPAITGYTVGLSVTVRVPAANNAINTQLALNGLDSVEIYKNNGTSLDVGELQSGYYTLVYGANSAFYLQGATAQPASDAETQVTGTVGANSTKFISPLRLFYWWNWIKVTAQNITSKWTFSAIRLNPSAGSTGVLDGDLWAAGSDLNFRDSGFNNKLLKKQNNFDYQGATTRLLATTAAGDLVASNELGDLFVVDSDLIVAITGATYTNGTATITPANSKVLQPGQFYQSGNFLYLCVLDNHVFRIQGA